MKKYYWILVIIICLGIFLRFYRLGEVPVGFHRDEAFLGYNAYSILQTGKDMTGNVLPLHLESFLYSPAGYSYFSIPFIWLLDLSTFSVRLASAVLGVFTIILTYILTIKLFNKDKKKQWFGLLSALFLTVSPWHIILSRTATENSIVVFFITLGVLLFVYFIDIKKLPFLFLSFLSFGITFFIYQAPRAFLPIFIPFLFLLSRSQITTKRQIIFIVLFVITILVPLLAILTSPTLSLRIRTVSVFDSSETRLVITDMAHSDGISHIPSYFSRVFHNKLIGYGQLFLQNYFKHVSYDFLFTDSFYPLRYKIPLVGLLYSIELPILIAGIWFLLQKMRKIGVFLIGWILFAFIGPAFTYDDIPNMQRTLIVFPAVSIILSYGLVTLFSMWDKKKFITYSFGTFIVGILTFQILFFIHQYFVHGAFYQPWHRNDGYKELVTNVQKITLSYKKAVVTNRESAPTIFFLFYNKYNPALFQKETKNSTLRDFDRVHFGQFEFSQEECPARIEINQQGNRLIAEKGVLYVNSGLCKEIAQLKTLKTIKRVDGSTVFRIVTMK